MPYQRKTYRLTPVREPPFEPQRGHVSTLLFCTSYATSEREWQTRYLRWLRRAQRSGLNFSKVAIIDDGSPIVPDWAEVLNPNGVESPIMTNREMRKEVDLYHFARNLGRSSVLDFPGWYRSFAYSTMIARAMNASKIIHIESDAAIVSTEMIDYINAFSCGWMSPYSKMYGFPEMAIQIIAGNSLSQFYQLFSKDYDWLRGRVHETALPLTHIVRSFSGDRYVGQADVTRTSDFVCQIPPEREEEFFWWDDALGTSAPPRAGLSAGSELFCLDFKGGGNAVEHCGLGWAAPEEHFRWTVGYDSVVTLPPCVAADAIVFDAQPCLESRLLPFQKIEVYLDDCCLARFKMTQRARIKIDLPATGTGQGQLRFRHPDVLPAHVLSPNISDNRELGLALFSLCLVKSSG